ncbi:MAG: hypothetical protein IV092_06515 [Burkholderiaceae bacterium]|nr:hypothetical protein [Burkholderiaceae bacterium]
MKFLKPISRSTLQFALTTALAVLGSLAMTQQAMAAEAGKTRQAVQAELAQARADGTVAKLAADTELAPPVKAFGGRSRAEVIAELVQARAEGMMASNNEADPFTTQNLAAARAENAVGQVAKATKSGR